jgi:hypothetical protein
MWTDLAEALSVFVRESPLASGCETCSQSRWRSSGPAGCKTLIAAMALLIVLFRQSLCEATQGKLPPAASVRIDFSRDVEPLLRERCQACHSANQQLGGLRLDDHEEALRGGYSGAVIIPGNSANSRLIHLVAGIQPGLVMPMQGQRLTVTQVGILRAWIDQGARWPESSNGLVQPQKSQKPDETSKHWAFNRPSRTTIPNVRNQSWVKNPIDAFVLQKLEAAKIIPSPEADRSILMRRLSLDLVGLPPAPEEVTRFLADKKPNAYERLVDRLLDSPHYGEKWARQWLDLAHYADSDGYWDDLPRPYAWRWRQWVIDALNSNMRFDQFTIGQLAGDLLAGATLEQRIGTGFLRNTLTNREGGVSKEEFRVEQVVDRASTVATVWLGLTLGCARCHDHKYDPITQKDFYQFYAFFNAANEANLEVPLPGEMGSYLRRRPEYNSKRKAILDEFKLADQISEWEKQTLDAESNPQAEFRWRHQWILLTFQLDNGTEILKQVPERRTQKQQDRLINHFVKWYSYAISKEKGKELKLEELAGKLQKLDEEYPELTEAQTVCESASRVETRVLIRGDYRQPGIEVPPGTPSIFGYSHPVGSMSRLDLARWLVTSENPLTARVTVNRLWQELFGRGLVATSDDFGKRAAPPTHPELLDWLAVEFESGWNVKRMIKLIVESATYRQSSNARKELLPMDPENTLLARQNHLRLPAELIRDVALSAGGLLNTTIGGPSIRPVMPKGGYIKTNLKQWKESEGAERYRRGIYVWFQRTSPYPQLMTFDAPDSLQSCSRRERSTTPLQALNLLNDPVFVEAAQGLAARVQRERSGTLSDRLRYAFEVCLTRPPRPIELERLSKYYFQQKPELVADPETRKSLFPAEGVEGVDAGEAAIWVGLSSILLNLDEFITRR